MPMKRPSPLISESQCFRVPVAGCDALRAKVSVSFDIVGILQVLVCYVVILGDRLCN